MKELVLYLFLLTVIRLAFLTYNHSSPTDDSLPYLSTYQTLIVLGGDLPPGHSSLYLYQRVYLLSDSASAAVHPPPIRLFNQKEQMTGIINMYESFELSPEAMSEGFLDIGNIGSFMSKTLLLPLDGHRCQG